MSDSESIAEPARPHPSVGGKSLEVLERPRYRSWRKKYRKMRVKFDATLEENKRLFKEEHKLQLITQRLKEELDGLLDLCLDLNQTPELPAELRFDVRHPDRPYSNRHGVPPQLSLEMGDAILGDAIDAVNKGMLAPLEIQTIKDEVLFRLAMQDATPLAKLEQATKQPLVTPETEMPPDMLGADLPGYMTIEQETIYLQLLDQQLETQPLLAQPSGTKESTGKSVIDLTSKELDRQTELLNPQSQHNWLKTHTKPQTDGDDAESLASHEVKPTRRRGPNKNLAKQIGDRAIGRAREGYSPGAGSGYDDDELSLGFIDDHPATSSGRKKAKDPDGTYRSKAGKSSTPSAAKGKRKRNSGDDGAHGASNGSGKKAKVGTPSES